MEVDLNDMPYARGARFDREKECLAGTREDILDELTDFINSTEDIPRICVLSGAAGTGKSAIAHTLARRFYQLRCLGSSFCFDRTYQTERRPDNVFGTVAHDLANFDPMVKRALGQVIRDDRALRTMRDVEEQLETFILKPAAQLRIVGPILIIIDALDESSDPRSRHRLLSLLANRMTELPGNFRILLTSRPEKDIEDIFSQNDRIVYKRMDTIERSSTNDDILTYICTRLNGHLDNRNCRLLASKAEGLFQWAFTACEAIEGLGEAGLSAAERFDRVISASQDNEMGPLDSLYLGILSQLFRRTDTTIMDRFKSVMGQIMTTFEPLSIDSLTQMRQHTSIVEDDMKLIVQFMGSVLSGVGQHSTPIRPLHTSFRDFLTDPLHSREFYINTSDQHKGLAVASLQVMKAELRFNICALETSYVRNQDIPDLADCIKECIPLHLSYSCRFWAEHLRATGFNSGVLAEVKDHLYKRLLFWLEVLSLVGVINISPRALSHVYEWCMVRFSGHCSPRTMT